MQAQHASSTCLPNVMAMMRLVSAHLMQVYANDLNPDSYRYLKENIRINKVTQCIVVGLAEICHLGANFESIDNIICDASW